MSTDVGGSVDVDDAADSAPAAVPEPPPPPPSSPAPVRARRRRRRWPQLGIQSKLLMMLLVTSIVSCIVVGLVGYRSGRESLRDQAFEQLQLVRNARANDVEREYARLVSNLVVFTQGQTAIQAVQDFDEGFRELEDATVTAEQQSEIESYYADVFVPEFEGEFRTTPLPDAFVPDDPAQRYLQAAYTVPPGGDFDAALEVDDAGDGSAWSAAHARYHQFFRELVNQYNYEDVLLLDPEGNVIYTAYKGVDLGTNIMDGPYDGSLLAQAFEQAMESNALDFSATTDLERYQPSYGRPTGWAVSPVGGESELIGAMALQIPLDNINAIMTDDESWVDDGLGETGETYLVGRDDLMRSAARLVLEDPDAYERAAVAAGTPPEIAAAAANVGGTVLFQPVETTQVERAQQGETGELVSRDYFGNEVLSAYAPVELGDVGWVVVAELDTSEAFEPVNDFARRIVLTTAAIIVAVALASLLLAQIFSRPVKRMMGGVRQVAAGNLGAQVPTSSTDEFADLAAAFNDMSRSLLIKQELLEAEQAENERLLLTMMPQTVAQRYRQGEQTISQDHQDVAVVYADVAGFNDYAAALDSSTSLGQLNELVRQFDEAAARIGVERIRTLRNGYLFSCGMVLPRVDNALRALDFTREMRTVVERFNRINGTDLSLRAAIDAGRVTSGLVGRSAVLYDLWGDAVNLALKVQGSLTQPGIYVTGRVYDRLRDAVQFDPAGDVDDSSGRQQVWRLAE